jgi:hypothetical protein
MVNSLKYMMMGLRVHNHSAPSTLSQPPMSIENMRFKVVLTILEMHIFTTPPTFHGTSIGNLDFKIVDCMNITIGFLGNMMMNKIMGATISN